MSEKRLSKLQKEILSQLYKNKKKYKWKKSMWRYELMKDVASIYDTNKKDVTAQGFGITVPSDNFKIIFSQSLRNLYKKGLVKLIFCHEVPRLGFHRIKTCEGRSPKSDEPCDDCPYLEKFGCEPGDFTVEDKTSGFYDGKCYFMVQVGYSGKQGYKQRVHDVEITDKGKKALFRSCVTPKMIKETEKERSWYISQLKDLGFDNREEDPTLDVLLEKKVINDLKFNEVK